MKKSTRVLCLILAGLFILGALISLFAGLLA